MYREASSGTKSRISLPNLSLKSPKIQLSRFGNLTPQSAMARRDELLSPKKLVLEETDMSISKQKLHILGRILKKAIIPHTTKASVPKEISDMEKENMARTPKREPKDHVLKEVSINNNDEPNFTKVDNHQIQPKVLKDNSKTCFNR